MKALQRWTILRHIPNCIVGVITHLVSRIAARSTSPTTGRAKQNGWVIFGIHDALAIAGPIPLHWNYYGFLNVKCQWSIERLKSVTMSVSADGAAIYIPVHGWSKYDKEPCLGAQAGDTNPKHNEVQCATMHKSDTLPLDYTPLYLKGYLYIARALNWIPCLS